MLIHEGGTLFFNKGHNSGGHILGNPSNVTWVWGSWGDRLFIFRELGSTGNYFRGASTYFWSTAKKAKKKRFSHSIIFRDQGSTDPPVGASKVNQIIY